MNNKWTKKLMAGLLAASMAFSNIPVTAFAEEVAVEETKAAEAKEEPKTEEAFKA